MSKKEVQNTQEYSILYFLKDPPNICSLVGLLSSFMGIYFTLMEKYSYALIGAVWAVVFDWLDGMIARSLKNRTNTHRAVGRELDSLIDIVNFGIFPSIFLLSYGRFRPLFIPGAFLIVAGSALRLSYFNVCGMIDKNTYKGLALDNNIIILSFMFLFERFCSYQIFSIFIYTVMLILLLFNVASIRTPKFGGKWFYGLLIYTVIISIYYGCVQ